MSIPNLRDDLRTKISELLEHARDRHGHPPDHITLLFPKDLVVTAVDVVANVDTLRVIEALDHALKRLRATNGDAE
jgi:hypothetical protein